MWRRGDLVRSPLLWLILAVAVILVLDKTYLGWDLPVLLGRLLFEAIETLAFWR